MAVIKPFNALRPTKESAQKVASVPYDVVNRAEAKAYAENNSLSFLRISRSEIELPEKTDVYAKEVYQKAKESLERIKKEAPLIMEEKASLYLYRLIMDGRPQVGIAATFSVDDYDNDIILKHEKTRKVKEDDRTNHIITTEAQTGVVFLTYRGVDAVNKIVNKTMSDTEPLYDFTSVDEIRHTVWVIPEYFNQSVIDEIGKVDKLYIADGHHRAASASRARRVKQNNNPRHNGKEEYNFFIAVLFPAEQLKILPYNRVVFNLNGYGKGDFINLLSDKFVVEKTDSKEPVERRTFRMYFEKQWFSLTPRDSVLASLKLTNSVAETLDASILQDFLLNPILGIDDPRTNKNIDFIGGIRGTKELELLVDGGKAAVAFSLYPVSVDDLMSISDAGEVMPPKSTWFEPKLRDGLLSHLI